MTITSIQINYSYLEVYLKHLIKRQAHKTSNIYKKIMKAENVKIIYTFNITLCFDFKQFITYFYMYKTICVKRRTILGYPPKKLFFKSVKNILII